MSGTVWIEEAQAHLAEIIENLVPGETLVITQGDRPVAKLIAEAPATKSNSVTEFPTIDVGPWPEGLSLRREDIHGDDGRDPIIVDTNVLNICECGFFSTAPDRFERYS